MMKHLVVGVDGSQYSEMACHWAIALASQTGASITVAQIVDYSVAADSPLDSLCAKCSDAMARADLSARVKLLHGDPPRRMLELAADIEADMMVVGRRHRSPLAPHLLGSFTRRLLQENEVPIAVIPAPPDLGPVALREPKAIVGLDGSTSSRPVLAVAAALSSALDLELEAVSVVDIHEEFVASRGAAARRDVRFAQRYLEGLISDVRPNLRHTIAVHTAVGVASDELLRCSSRAEMLVVGHRRATPIGRFLTHATSRYSAAHATCPVVLVPVEPIPSSERKVASNG